MKVIDDSLRNLINYLYLCKDPDILFYRNNFTPLGTNISRAMIDRVITESTRYTGVSYIEGRLYD